MLSNLHYLLFLAIMSVEILTIFETFNASTVVEREWMNY